MVAKCALVALAVAVLSVEGAPVADESCAMQVQTGKLASGGGSAVSLPPGVCKFLRYAEIVPGFSSLVKFVLDLPFLCPPKSTTTAKKQKNCYKPTLLFQCTPLVMDADADWQGCFANLEMCEQEMQRSRCTEPPVPLTKPANRKCPEFADAIQTTIAGDLDECRNWCERSASDAGQCCYDGTTTTNCGRFPAAPVLVAATSSAFYCSPECHKDADCKSDAWPALKKINFLCDNNDNVCKPKCTKGQDLTTACVCKGDLKPDIKEGKCVTTKE